MALASELQHVYFIRCDGCYRRARYAFHRIVAVGYAKHQGYTRHDLGGSDVVWVCKRCSGIPSVMKTLELNVAKKISAPVPAVKPKT